MIFSSAQVPNRDFRGADFFVVLGVDGTDRPGWVVWEENGRYPDVSLFHHSRQRKIRNLLYMRCLE
jgi:hypothetical protein